MIPARFLKKLADRKGVSEAELEAMSLALNGEPTLEIAKNLKISEAAVRKRLGEVYHKFEIKGEGSGKLVKLRELLERQYERHYAPTRILLAWSGHDGRQLAEGLKNTILAHRQLDPWLLQMDTASVQSGSLPDAELEDTTVGLGCFTASASSWINFEIGILKGRLQTLKMLNVGQSLSGPIAALPAIKSQHPEEWIDFLQDLLGDEREDAEQWVELTFPRWQQIFTQVLEQPIKLDFHDLLQSVEQLLSGLKGNPAVQRNSCFQSILTESLNDLKRQLDLTQDSYSVPAVLYPHYLNALQRKFEATVRALAIVDREEYFWQEEVGRNIGETAQPISVRVFAFMRPKDFERNFEVLLEHATRYKVYVINYDTLAKDFPSFCRDLAIIELDRSKVLAEYVGKEPLRQTRFCASEEEVLRSETVLNRIIQGAIEIEKRDQLPASSAQILGLMQNYRDLIFEQPLLLLTKSVGMSIYIDIDIDDYDQHVEKHIYMQTMMSRMLEILTQHRGKESKTRRVLEMGAGTGIFTRRLAKLPNLQIEAIELDWVCYKKLQHNLASYPFIRMLNRDSCTFDPADRFDYVVSSFADHHIQSKELYLRNVKRNLEPDGRFIIGDEFLPDHDLHDLLARQRALLAYHNHIIEIAQQQGEVLLEKLERDALHSGLERSGDFKLSCQQYEKLSCCAA
jgi:SAM-dependent methyltransferase/DNA-binding CsgD family transcriptional regulator